MLLVFIFVVALIFRIVPLKTWQIEGSDAWSHILDAQLIKQNNGKIPKKVKRFFPEPEFTYPWAISWLLYKFEPANPVRFGVWLNIVFSMAEMVAAALFTWWIALNLAHYSSESAYYAVAFTMGIYSVSPLVVSPWAGVYGVNARVFGAFASNVALLTLVISMHADSLWILCLPVVLIALVVFASQFAVQALILGTTVLSLVFGSLVPVLILMLGVALPIFCSKGKAYSILKGHFYHVKYYFKHLQYHNVSTVYRTWGVLRWAKEAARTKRAVASLKSMIWVPALRVVIWNSWLVILLASFFVGQNKEFLMGLGSLVLAGLIVVPIITLRHVRFLGEPDRYFTFMATMPLAVLIGVLVADYSELAPLYFLVLAGCLFASLAMIWENSKISKDEGARSEIELAKALDELVAQDMGTENRVLVVPQNISDKIACFCACTFVGIHTNVTSNERKWHYYYRMFTKFYPYPTCDENDLKRVFGVGYVVVAKRFISDSYLARHYLSKKEVVAEPTGEPVYENDRYVVYAV